MACLVLCVVALCAFGALADSNPIPKDNLKDIQIQLLDLYYHIGEPIETVASDWDLESNVNDFKNVTAATLFAGMLKNKWVVPRSKPFSVNEPSHAVEALNLFNVLYTAKDYDTFYKAALYFRNIVNEGIFVYTLSIAIIYRQDTQGVQIPPIYDVFPSYFINGEIVATALRINSHGHLHIENYPSTYTKGDSVIIKWNETVWPYYNSEFALSYFTNDVDLTAAQYYQALVSPYWLGGQLEPSVIFKSRRGESWWYAHKQLVARYYMERLSNGYGEIPDITDTVKEGFTSGLLYPSGIPFPSRPDNFDLTQPELAGELAQVKAFESYIYEAIDKGFYLTREGEKVSLLNDNGLEALGLLIESNADSPNRFLYKDFIRIWKKILGNSIKPGYQYANKFAPLVAPSALENYETSLRDPAFYSLWKRILNFFLQWQKQQPLYTPQELTLKSVTIEKVETDKLVTFFENSYLNISNLLYSTEVEAQGKYEDVSVLVEQPRLNHKPFSIKVTVKSDDAKKVLVKFFLAPKYDSNGFEIPLHLNTENFFMLEQFIYDLPAGESVITRKSADYLYTKKWESAYEIYEKAVKGEFKPYQRSMSVFPHNLVLPKGTVDGLTFKLAVFIQEYDSSAAIPGGHVIGYPTDRPLYSFQVKDVKNLYFQDVEIFHKKVVEVSTPLTY